MSKPSSHPAERFLGQIERRTISRAAAGLSVRSSLFDLQSAIGRPLTRLEGEAGEEGEDGHEHQALGGVRR